MENLPLQLSPAGLRRSVSTPNFKGPQLSLPWQVRQANSHSSGSGGSGIASAQQLAEAGSVLDTQLTISSLAEAFNRQPAVSKPARALAPNEASGGSTSGCAATSSSSSSSRTTTTTTTTTSGALSELLAAPQAAPRLAPLEASSMYGTEVYVVARPFTEWGGGLMNKLSPDLREGMVHMGVCHYMTVFRTPDGRLTQFDFGPRGGDVRKVRGPFRGLFGGGRTLDRCADKAASNLEAFEGSAKSVAGEVRERTVTELPTSHLYVGRTNLTLADIRAYSRTHAMVYELHKNDCRHFVNNLVRYTTGFEAATNRMVRHHYLQRHRDSGLRWHQPLIGTVQLVTDVGNWEKLCRASQATLAGLLALSGRTWIGTIKPVLALNAASTAANSALAVLPSAFANVLSLPASLPGWVPQMSVATALPAAKATLVKRPLATTAVATAAAAGATLRESPAGSELSSVLERVRSATTVAVQNIGTAARSIGTAAAAVRSQGVALSRSATDTTAALAAAAGRRAAVALHQRLPRAWPSLPKLSVGTSHGGQQLLAQAGSAWGPQQAQAMAGKVVVMRR